MKEPDPTPERKPRRRRFATLPLHVRIGLFLVGWLLVLIGIAGLVLPGIQGILTIFVGAAILSLVSELFYEMLQSLLQRWPRVWRKVEYFRARLYRKLRRRRRRKRAQKDKAPPE